MIEIDRFQKLRADTVNLRLAFIRSELDLATTFANMAARQKKDGRVADCARLKSKAETARKQVQGYLMDRAIMLSIDDRKRLRGELKLLRDFIGTL